MAKVTGVPPSQRRRHTLAVVFVMWCAVALYAASVPVMLRLNGERLVTLVSGSMSPVYPTGSVLILDPLAASESVSVGDVITANVGGALPLTHRVIERVSLPKGVALRTRGDANAVPDARLVTRAEVLGRITGPVPTWMSPALTLQDKPWHLVLFALPLILIVGSEVRGLALHFRRRE